MSLISLQGACFDFGRETIIDQVNLSIFAGVKYALVGVNGAGKTTLLELLAGRLPLQRGDRQVAGSVQIRTLHQETTRDPLWQTGATLYDCVREEAFADELALERELARIAEALVEASAAEHDELVARQGRLQVDYERRGGYTLKPRLEETLRGVGLAPETWQRPPSRLSGGERRRGALAATLLARSDVLLLDEPTNHLDLQACEWLEGFLVRFAGAAVLVSHDRQFLDRVSGQTLHLERGKLTSYSGNYTFFDRAYLRQRKQQQMAYERQQEMIRRAEDYIQRNIAGQKTKQAQSRRRKLEKVERLAKPLAEPSGYRLTFEPSRPSGRVVLEVEKISKGYAGTPLVHDFDLLVTRGERIGIVGPNGCGKTTLLNLLAGRANPDSGSVTLGHHVDLGLYDQHIHTVNDRHTVIEELATTDPTATVGQLRSALGAFGFGEDLIDRPVGRLSGGERGRLALLRLIKEGHNTLLLDEPTNHLDFLCREALEEALAGYGGTLIVVSHDRRFLNRLVEKLIVFAPDRDAGNLQVFVGNYGDWRRWWQSRRQAAQEERAAPSADARQKPARTEPVEPKPSPADGALSKNEQQRRRRWIAAVEREIADLESERERLLEAMVSEDLSAPERTEAGRRCAEVESRIAAKLQQWEQWNLELETARREN